MQFAALLRQRPHAWHVTEDAATSLTTSTSEACICASVSFGLDSQITTNLASPSDWLCVINLHLFHCRRTRLTRVLQSHQEIHPGAGGAPGNCSRFARDQGVQRPAPHRPVPAAGLALGCRSRVHRVGPPRHVAKAATARRRTQVAAGLEQPTERGRQQQLAAAVRLWFRFHNQNRAARLAQLSGAQVVWHLSRCMLNSQKRRMLHLPASLRLKRQQHHGVASGGTRGEAHFSIAAALLWTAQSTSSRLALRRSRHRCIADNSFHSFPVTALYSA